MVRVFGPSNGVTVPQAPSIAGKIVTGIYINPGDTITVSWSLSQYVAGSGQWNIDVGIDNTPGSSPPDGHYTTYTHNWDNHNGGTHTWTSSWQGDRGFVNLYGPTTNGYLDGVTVDTTGSLTPPAPCPYGTQMKPGQDAQVWLSDTLLQLVIAALPQSWWGILLGVYAGQALNVANMCASLPIIPPPPVAADFLPPFIGLQKYVAPMLWNYFCQCASGPSGTRPPVVDFGPKPTGLADDRTIVVNPTNPCLDLTEVRRMLDRIMKVLGQDYALDTLMQRYELPFATVLGATHSGLGGSGSFNISRLIGVQITITARPPNKELEGAPHYIWDLGWISCMDGNGFIQERRITRDVEVWMPREFQEATILGYSFKTGVTGNITELQAES